jgi:hypothetical protein
MGRYNISTTHTPETLDVYAAEVEEQAARIRACCQKLRDNGIPTTEAKNDDSFHVAMKKMKAFTRELEKAVAEDLVANIRARQEASKKHTVPAKKKKTPE